MERVVNGSIYDIAASGPVIPVQLQVNAGTVASSTTVVWPSTIAAGGTFTTGSNPIGIQGLPHCAVGGILSQAGTVSVQAYLDTAANIPVGSATTGNITANTPFTLDTNLGTVALAQTIGISIHNNGGVAATLTNPVLVLQSS